METHGDEGALETHGETEVRLLRSSQRSLCAPFGLAWRVLAQYCERTRETFRRKVSRSAHRRIFGNDISAKVNGRADTAYTAARTANEMEDTRIYNYIDIIDIPDDDFLGMWYYELDSGKLNEAKAPPHYLKLSILRRRMHPIPIIAFIFFYKEQALKVKEKLLKSDKDAEGFARDNTAKRVVSFNWLSEDLQKRKAPRIDSTEYLDLFPIDLNPPIDLNELEQYIKPQTDTPRRTILLKS